MMERMLSYVVLLMLAGGALSQRCALSSIPVKTDLVESQMGGRWYEMQWIASTRERFADKYTDLVQVLTPVSPSGFRDQGVWRWASRPAGQECAEYKLRINPRLAPGKYKIQRPNFPDAQKWIVDTDYVTYLIEFACLRISSDGIYCEQSEVLLFTRQPQVINSAVFSQVVQRFNSIFVGRSCLRLEYTSNTQHLYPGVCETPLIGYPYGSNIYGANIYGANIYGYGYPYSNIHGVLGGHHMDPTVVAVQKEMLVAEKAKLITEKEMLVLMTEKLRLEIDILRRGGSIPK